MGGPYNERGHSQDYRDGRGTWELDQALIETASDVGRLN